MENKFIGINSLGKALVNELDFDFSINEKYISTLEEFNELLKRPFTEKKRKIFYRGERINDLSRPLIPTFLRDRKMLLREGELVVNIDSNNIIIFLKAFSAMLQDTGFMKYVRFPSIILIFRRLLILRNLFMLHFPLQ